MNLVIGDIYHTKLGTLILVDEREHHLGTRVVTVNPVSYNTEGIILNDDGTFDLPREAFVLVVSRMTELQMLAN